jgi:hypothetical protein
MNRHAGMHKNGSGCSDASFTLLCKFLLIFRVRPGVLT